jgi:hypothetical protein
MNKDLHNSLGFEGDTYLKDMFQKLIKEQNIKTVIETGGYLGATTKQFSKMLNVIRVYTIEINKEYTNKYPETFKNFYNISITSGDSAIKLWELINTLKIQRRITPEARDVLFYLDAHWGGETPLLKELSHIAYFGLKPIIAIHDFKVPNNENLGFDVYGDIVYEWSYIENHIKEIYGENGFEVFYNNENESCGAKRGVCFIKNKN